MSRHSFFPKEDSSSWVVVVGWDAALQSFFFQYGDPGSDLPLMLATGQRIAEHPTADLVVALAEHLGERIPPNLAVLLQDDRRTEGYAEHMPSPNLITFTTQADNGEELGFTVARTDLSDPRKIGDVADRVLGGALG